MKLKATIAHRESTRAKRPDFRELIGVVAQMTHRCAPAACDRSDLGIPTIFGDRTKQCPAHAATQGRVVKDRDFVPSVSVGAPPDRGASQPARTTSEPLSKTTPPIEPSAVLSVSGRGADCLHQASQLSIGAALPAVQ